MKRCHRAAAPLALAALAALLFAAAPSHAGGCDVADFDLTISLEAEPRDDDELERYEDIIEDFANGVYAATECQHRIGRVEIWRGGQADDRADIIWRERALPMSSPNGRGRPGLRMYMTDHFARPDEPGEDPALNDVSLVFDRTAPAATAGALLAHEWAHYAYGLEDEHVVLEEDLAVEPSLMSSPWEAATDPEWMNFSIDGPGTGPFQDTGETEQHRVHGRSAWSVLSDTEIGLDVLLTSPLPGVALRDAQGLMPPAGLPSSGEGGGTDALDIVWQDRCASYVIAIDNSGSMAGNPLSRAKEVATTLIEEMTADATWLSIVSFHDTAVVRHGPLLVSDEPDDDDEDMNERQRFLDAVEAIAAVAKDTFFSAGLETALANAGTCTSPVSTRAVFLVSDGSNTEDGELPGGALDGVLADYEAEGVAIHSLNVGTAEDSATDLIPTATRTGGIVFGPAATSPQALQAFDEAESLLAFRLELAAGTLTVEPESSVTVPFSVDSTFSHLRVCARGTEDSQLSFRTPQNVVLLPTSTRDAGNEDDRCSTLFTSTPPAPGGWELIATAAIDATEDAEVTYEVVATAAGSTYMLDASIVNAPSGTIQAPAPILVTATVWNGLPIIGARVEMSVDGGLEIPLRDDGLAPDEIADDGTYAGAASYDLAGCEALPETCPVIVVRATNPFDSATFTANGLRIGTDRIAITPTPAADRRVAEDFERVVTLEVMTIAAPPSAPITTTDPVSGVVQTPGEAPTRFEIDVCAVLPDFAVTPEPLEARASGALLGMVPRLEVFLGDPDLPETRSIEATAVNREAGVAIVVEAADLACGTPVYALVSHATGGTGTYQFSAGPVLGLTFGRAGPGDSPCEIARLDLEFASTALLGVDGLEASRLLVDSSRDTQEDLRNAIRDSDTTTGDEQRAAKLLKKSIKRSKKASKLIEKTEKKGFNEDEVLDRIEKIEKRIERAREKLDDACELLPAGGAGFVVEDALDA